MSATPTLTLAQFQSLPPAMREMLESYGDAAYRPYLEAAPPAAARAIQAAPTAPECVSFDRDAGEQVASLGYGLLRTAAMVGAVVHGYRRNDGSVLAAVGWGVIAGAFPVITTGVMLGQGFGEPQGDR